MSDSNQDAVALITSALATSREGLSPAAVQRFRSDVVTVMRGIKSPNEYADLLSVLALMSAGLLDTASELSPTDLSAEDLLRTLALRSLKE